MVQAVENIGRVFAPDELENQRLVHEEADALDDLIADLRACARSPRTTEITKALQVFSATRAAFAESVWSLRRSIGN